MTHNMLLTGTGQVTTFSNGKSFPTKFLQDQLPDVETLLFFAKVYELEAQDVATLLHDCVPSDVVNAFTAEAYAHSLDLQDYLVDLYQNEDGEWEYADATCVQGMPGTEAEVEPEILPEVWKNLEVEIASSIQEVANTIADTVQHMPGRTGEMIFRTLAKMNRRRPSLGEYLPGFKHKQVKKVLVVFDVSGSMSETTVKTIVDDVVGLAYEANASLAIVSDTCTWWPAGGYSTTDVLAAAEYRGTHYEQLVPLFQENWDAVIAIADYDSAFSAMRALAGCKGRIGQLFDVSLVNRSTYLGECLAQLADEVRPLLIASDTARLTW